MEERNLEAGASGAGELWGDAIHELRQPLQSLLLLAHVVARSDDPAAREKGARHMEAALLRLQSMLELLGRTSRLQSGAAVPVPESCDLATRITGQEPALAALAGLAHRQLHVSAKGGFLSCDATLLTTMIRGMVGCAARYGAGDIDLSCEAGANGGLVVCSFPAEADATPGRDVFVDLAGGSLSDTVAEPVPGLALVERMAEVAGLRLELAPVAGRRLELTLSKAV